MIGAIAGDIIGSVYESHCLKTTEFAIFTANSTFTDDTVLTIAVADCILHNKDYATTFKHYARKYPYAGFGGMFFKWVKSDSLEPYNSFGNGSAMRVSPVGFAFDTMEEVLAEAKRSAEVTHNHPEGIKGAQAIAAAILLARKQESKGKIKDFIENDFGYDLNKTLAEIRPYYHFDETCEGSVPQAVIAFLESDSYEDAVRKAISLGGDSDTLACMAGGIAQAYYKTVPDYIIREVKNRLDPELLKVVEEFNTKYCPSSNSTHTIDLGGGTKMDNVLMVIEPYWYQGTWVFDDASKGLDKEPFVQGIPEMIDTLVKDIPNARAGFVLLFSAQPFAGYQVELTLIRAEYGGHWYKPKDLDTQGWLCPALLRYFDDAPQSLYIKAEAGRGRFEPTELEALKKRIEELEQLVGKLTLENEALKQGRNK